MKKLFRDILRASWFQKFVGLLVAGFLRLVWITNKFGYDPVDIYELIDKQVPIITAFWHGQHLMTPFIKRAGDRVKGLISLHRDGEFNALAVERLGVETVRGSGDHGSAFHRKGGVRAFKEMLRALEDNCNIALTADVPKRSRVAGLGVIMLARESGRPIMPVAMATSRFIRLKNWDRTTINLPFGRGVMACGELISVPPDADDDMMETLRVRLEASLNDATRRAYAQVGRPEVEAGHA